MGKKLYELRNKETKLPWCPSRKESSANEGDMGLILDPGRFHMPQSN